jgi:hypothetical protein
MKRTTLLAALGLAALAAAAPDALTYRFDEVQKTVVRTNAGSATEKPVVAGDVAKAGDGIRTGAGARAVVSVPERRARFEIGPSTKAVLQGGQPGVLLVLEKGKLKAFFDALTGEPAVERRVAAPGALLAVRGTRYGVEVSESGETTLVVFEGTVEVLPTAFAPVLVGAGYLCTFGPRTPPVAGPMKDRGVSEPSWDRRDRSDDSIKSRDQSNRSQPDRPQPARSQSEGQKSESSRSGSSTGSREGSSQDSSRPH